MVDATFDDPDKNKNDNDPNKDVPDQFKAMSKADMAKVIEKQEEGLTGLTGRFNTLAGQFNNMLEEKAGEGKKDADKDAQKPTWEEQPEAAAKALFDEKMAPYAKAFMSHAEEQNLTDLTKLPYYEEFKPQIDEMLSQSSAQAKAVPGYAISAYNMVVGANLAKVKEIDTKRAEKAAEHTETESSAGTGGKDKPPEESLTEAQARVADGQGIPRAKYAAWLKDPAKMRTETLAGAQGK